MIHSLPFFLILSLSLFLPSSVSKYNYACVCARPARTTAFRWTKEKERKKEKTKQTDENSFERVSTYRLPLSRRPHNSLAAHLPSATSLLLCRRQRRRRRRLLRPKFLERSGVNIINETESALPGAMTSLSDRRKETRQTKRAEEFGGEKKRTNSNPLPNNEAIKEQPGPIYRRKKLRRDVKISYPLPPTS